MSDDRKVVIYRNELLPWSETFICEQARTLRHWHPIMVGERRIPDGLPLDHLDTVLLPDSRAHRLSRLASRLGRVVGVAYAPHVAAMKDIGPRLIHAHFGLDGTDIWPVAHSLKIPLLVTLHGYDINISQGWWRSGKGGLFRVDYPRQLLRMSKDPKVHFIAVSEAIKRRAIEYGIAKEKITVAHIGIDTKQFKPSINTLRHHENRIVFVGRFVEKKAPLLMVQVYGRVKAHLPDAQLVMIGDGPLRAATEQLARTLMLPITFPGVLPPQQVLGELSKARALCLPSITAQNGDAEGFGLVLLEAQAAGVPVVSSALGGAEEGILNGITGFSCREHDLDCFADALLRCLSDDQLWATMSSAATEFVRTHFDLAQQTRQLEDIYSNHADNSGEEGKCSD